MAERIWTAALVVIGDEILSGRTHDKNIAQVASWLQVQGIRLAEVRVVPDVEERIVEAVNALRAANDYLFTTGGIGPTHDDITVDAIAKALGVQVVINPEARAMLERYFTLEDPSRFEPAAREQLVEVVVDCLRLRGYVDRLDVNDAGDIRVIDYKTGSTPREAFEGKALFQMKFYALVLWRTRGVVPRQLRLMYLADTDTLSYAPDAEELERFERTLRAIWAAIERATQTGDFRPSPSALCAWCSHQAICPEWGGTPPPLPEVTRQQIADPGLAPEDVD